MQAKSRLYGRRIRGDIGPIGIDPRTRLPGAILAPAVSLTGADQYYDEETAIQNFTLGSRMQVDDRVYYYSRASAAIALPTAAYRLAVSTDQILAINDLLSVGATLAGATQVVVTVGAFQGGVVAADELFGGYVEIWPVAGTGFMWRKITANTGTVVGGNITITVDRPMENVVGAASQVSIHPSVYRNVQSAVTAGLVGFATVVGLPPRAVQNGYYFWLQTWGPCFIAPTGAWPLSAANRYDVYFHQDGTTADFNAEYAAGANPSPQRVGYVMGAGNYGCGQVMLQLCP
jgi:hypothetical protein